MNKYFHDNGYCILENVFNGDEISLMRQISLNYFHEDGGFKDNTGRAKPDWIKDKKLQSLNKIVSSKNLDQIISGIIGEQVLFIGHNDLHVNRNVNWHKDRLNGEARRFEINNPWSKVGEETMKIYKVNIYLQDHSNNNDGLIVKKGSHVFEDMNYGEVVFLKPSLGSVVVFDQRITHRAQWSGGYNRFLICMGYGVKNCFFDEFQRGTKYRQDKQNAN